MEAFFSINDFATLGLLIGLELVLGIDNILLISILTSRLEQSRQESARKLGLFLAFLARVIFVLAAGWITKLTEPVLLHYSWKDLILLVGGLFLLYKAVKEIHHVVEGSQNGSGQAVKATFGAVITQIVLLDIVFSIDSVITAIGLTQHLWVIITAVMVSFAIVLFFARPVAQFVEHNPALKVLALAFLVCIGVTIFVEGLQKDVPKAYIYLPMGFALAVELLQMRMSSNMNKKKASGD